MSKEFLVEVVVCEQGVDGKRWTAHGQVVGEFATERRLVVTYDEISPTLRDAILAAEDHNFFRHSGLQPSRMVLALLNDVFKSGVTPGRSTLTQQLARNVFQDTIGFE